MSAIFRSLSCAALLLFAACSEDQTGGAPRSDGSTSTSSIADASGPTDAEADLDAALADVMSLDSGGFADAVSGGDTGANDAGATSAACDELGACCPQLPAGLQGNCTTTAGGGDDARCGQTLGLAQMGGYCVPGGMDATPREAGPLGPSCAQLEACCATVPQAIQATCTNTAQNGDEGRCDQILALAQRVGACQNPVDAGLADTGTSTVGDAGTSTTGDAG